MVVANAVRRRYDFFRPADHMTWVDEINFWRLSATNQFRALAAGEPFFF